MREATFSSSTSDQLAFAPGLLQRKCDCGNHTMSGECGDCAKKKGLLQWRLGAGLEAREVPSIVHQVLQSHGQALDAGSRAFFEPKLGAILGRTSVTPIATIPQRMTISQPGDSHEREADQVAEHVLEQPYGPANRDVQKQASRYDLSRIRVHTDAQAAESARAINALAYTVGNHIVFGRGSYAPHSEQGQRLLAHELAHTAQQAPVLARKPAAAAGTCLSGDECKDVITPSKLVAEARKESDERRKKREALCKKRPPDPGCRADRHGDRAVEVEKLLRSYAPSRSATTQGFFIDRDLEKDFGALTGTCSNFVPPLATTGFCTTVPIELEKEAEEFNTTTGPREIGGMERGLWRERTLEMIVHESEHTRFRTAFQADFFAKFSTARAPNIFGKPRPTCKRDESSQSKHFSSLSELASMLQEFPMRKEYLRSTVRLAVAGKEADLEEWRDHRMRGTSQAIPVSLRNVRCLCGCDDANDLLREAIKFATSSWSFSEVGELDQEMTDKRWNDLNLDWPFGSAASPKGDFPLRTLPEGEEYS